MGIVDQYFRDHAIMQNDIYRKGVLDRVMPVFNNIHQEAEEESQRYWDQLMAQPRDGNFDPSDLADQAVDHTYEHYSGLLFLEKETLNMATAGLYHLWEKELKDFLQHSVVKYGNVPIPRQKRKWWMLKCLQRNEVQYYPNVEMTKRSDAIKRGDIRYLKVVLAVNGFNFTQKPYYQKMDQLRQVTGALKHSKEVSEKIQRARPDLIDDDPWEVFWSKTLTVTKDAFIEFANSVNQFWHDFEITY